jgi:hypothetical protein
MGTSRALLQVVAQARRLRILAQMTICYYSLLLKLENLKLLHPNAAARFHVNWVQLQAMIQKLETRPDMSHY